MKKKLFMLLVIAFTVQFFGPSLNASEVTSEAPQVEYAPQNPTKAQVRAANPTDIVTFGDTKVEAAVAAKLNLTPGEITVADMSTLTHLNVGSNTVSDISGLEYAVNMDYLSLSFCNISDLTPLSGMTKLNSLYIEHNKISDFTPLSGLNNLYSLSAGYNDITNIEPIAKLPKLTGLYLSENKISDLSALNTATKLERLDISNNLITNISPLSNLTNLNDLNIAFNDVTDISAVENLTKLMWLYINDNNITDITPVTNLSSLTYFYFKDNNITDISPVANLTELRSLDFSNINSDVKVTDLSPLANLTDLDYLGASGNDITDVTPLAHLTNLKYLEIMNNKITDLTPLIDVANNPLTYAINANNQSIELEDITVTTDDEVIYNVTNAVGEQVPVSLGVPIKGVNNMTGTVSFFNNNIVYSGTFSRKVTYNKNEEVKSASTFEGKELTDDQLITLFNITENNGNPITVDQSAVNYHTPGDYNVIFTSGTNTINGTLTINDVIPVITLANPTITIKLGDKITDYLKSFGITVTEITHGDLTASIIVDDSKVNYNKAGKHQVTFKITDEEGNTVEQAGNIVIEESSKITPEEPKSEVKSENNNGKVKSEVESKEETSTKNKAMTLDNKKELTSTGFNTSVMMILLSFTTIVLVVLKKMIVRKI